MFPVRKNLYNPEIFMIHKNELYNLISSTDDVILIRHINKLIEKYNRERNALKDISYELRSWPNCYIGLSINDESSRPIIELALQVRMNDDLIMNIKELSYACGIAFMEEQYGLANEIAKLKELFLQSSFVAVKDILQVVTEDTLNYLLLYQQTQGCFENDKKIVFYNGEKHVVLDINGNAEKIPYMLVNSR